MLKNRRSLNIYKSRIVSFAFLLGSWISGAWLGIFVFNYARLSYSEMIQIAATRSVSITGLLCVIVVPFVISAIAVYCSTPVLVDVLCFLQAISFSVCTFAVFFFFGEAGWLTQFLVMFSGNITMVSLWFLWLHFFRCNLRVKPSFFCGCFLVAVIAGFVDVCVISPFLESVLKF